MFPQGRKIIDLWGIEVEKVILPRAREGKSINSSPEEVFISQRENMLAFLLPGKNLWPLNLGKNYFLLKIGLGKNYSFLGSIYTPVR